MVKAGNKVKAGDTIELDVPEAEEISVVPQDLPLDIVYQDHDIAVINKPQGMVTHPAPGNYEGTLVNALLYHIGDLSGINGQLRPGIVHRLDKDTSGLLIIAKNDGAHKALAEQIAQKTAQRIYLALVYGNIKDEEGTISTLLGRDVRDRKKMAVVRAGGREAVTNYRVLERYGNYTLVECRLKTGRTHQIRVHMKYIGHPVVGDPVYLSLIHICRDTEQLKKIKLYTQEYMARNGKKPSPKEIADEMGLSVERVLEVLEMQQADNILSLDSALAADSENFSLGNILGQEDASFEHVENHDFINYCMSLLNDTEKKIIEQRYLGNKTQKQVADMLHVSQMQISRMERKILNKLAMVYKK